MAARRHEPRTAGRAGAARRPHVARRHGVDNPGRRRAGGLVGGRGGAGAGRNGRDRRHGRRRRRPAPGAVDPRWRHPRRPRGHRRRRGRPGDGARRRRLARAAVRRARWSRRRSARPVVVGRDDAAGRRRSRGDRRACRRRRRHRADDVPLERRRDDVRARRDGATRTGRRLGRRVRGRGLHDGRCRHLGRRLGLDGAGRSALERRGAGRGGVRHDRRRRRGRRVARRDRWRPTRGVPGPRWGRRPPRRAGAPAGDDLRRAAPRDRRGRHGGRRGRAAGRRGGVQRVRRRR